MTPCCFLTPQVVGRQFSALETAPEWKKKPKKNQVSSEAALKLSVRKLLLVHASCDAQHLGVRYVSYGMYDMCIMCVFVCSQLPPTLETRGSKFVRFQEARIQESADEVGGWWLGGCQFWVELLSGKLFLPRVVPTPSLQDVKTRPWVLCCAQASSVVLFSGTHSVLQGGLSPSGLSSLSSLWRYTGCDS